MSLRRAFWARACFLGSTPDSARELASAMATMRTSAFSVVHSVVGGIQSSWASDPSR